MSSTTYRSAVHRLMAAAIAVTAICSAATACTDQSSVISDTRAELTTELAPRVTVTSCSPGTSDGRSIYPEIQEGAIPPSVTVRALLWCSYNDYHRQMVGLRDDAFVDTLAQLNDVTMTQAEADADCAAAVRTEPAIFALTDQGSYRVALPRNPSCGGPTAAVKRALDANNPTWLIVETQQR